MKLKKFDRIFIDDMHERGIPILRVVVGVVFLWFGLLKLFDVTPVFDLVADTYSFVPTRSFILALGVWEVLIGFGLIIHFRLRVVLLLLWLQMFGTLFAVFLSPSLFFVNANPLLLTMEGEFIVKNFVFIAASIVIGGFEIKRKL